MRGYFKCLWTGKPKDLDRTGSGACSPSPSSENRSEGCLSSVWQCALRPSSFALQAASALCLRHHPGQANLTHPGTHSSFLCPQAKPAGFSTGKQELKPALSNHDPSFSAFPHCQPGTVILTSFIRYFDIHLKGFFPPVRIPNHAERSAGLSARKILWWNKRLISVCPKACNLSRK